MKHETKLWTRTHSPCPGLASHSRLRRSKDSRTRGEADGHALATVAVRSAMSPDKRIAQLDAGRSPNIIEWSMIVHGPSASTHVRQCEAQLEDGVWN
jgi:hypothetical protein